MTSEPPRDPGTGEALELRILRSFRRIVRAIDLDSKRLAEQFQVTGPQLLCLTQLVAHERRTPSLLARDLHLSASTIVGILDRLEQKGLAIRERDATDRRLLWALPTDAGRALVGAAPLPLHETLSRGLARQSELERATIALSLERVVELIEAEAIEAAPILETGPLDA